MLEMSAAGSNDPTSQSMVLEHNQGINLNSSALGMTSNELQQ